ncbi:MAG: DUF4404 family protein [Psychromonas sp.]|nr:DUF4404 family protein [Psychromonas sp.]
MPIKKAKTHIEKLNNILREDLIADECTAKDLQLVHNQLQEAILSGDPSGRIKDQKLVQQLLLFEESHPAVGKVIRDLLNALSGMGI